MSRTYVVTIKNLAKNKAKKIMVESANPMEAHKEAFMSTKNNEEIMVIYDESDEVVYDLKHGFKQAY